MPTRRRREDDDLRLSPATVERLIKNGIIDPGLPGDGIVTLNRREVVDALGQYAGEKHRTVLDALALYDHEQED